ncbi:toll/interleukin-1 receptor domain-containing protein [Streptomyces sp. NPDC048172]|uniref:toll/interleukin-1 receptor domain-containing protein n=1 Tax=Streptomyces sp. NPDC048172 TaxID=3365505 RepID=UPI00371232BE
MPEIFINYRTGDGEKSAAALERELSHRFGSDHVFRASKSIRPGENFGESLLTNVRRSSAFIAVIGPRWLDAPDAADPSRRALDNRNDWVRKEIQEAFRCALHIVPVLDGRTMSRLDRKALPSALARLADYHSLRLDMQRGSADFLHIGDELAALVPRLAELESAREAPAAASDARASNTMGDPSGPGVQTSGDLHGGVAGTVINGASGPIHAGGGDLNHRTTRVTGGATYFENGGSSRVNNHFGHSPRRRTDGEFDEDDE